MVGALVLMYYTECAGNKNLCGKRTIVEKSSHPEEEYVSKSPKAPRGKFSWWEAQGKLETFDILKKVVTTGRWGKGFDGPGPP